MKKIFKIVFFIMTFLFFYYNVHALNYGSSVNLVEKYLSSKYDYKDTYERYIYKIPSNAVLSFYDNFDDSTTKFEYGGFLSEKEFNVTTRGKKNEYSYLFETEPFWTLTDGVSGGTKKIISSKVEDLPKENALPKTKVTEYLKNEVYVSGTGQYNDPWFIIPQHRVYIKTNFSSKGLLSLDNVNSDSNVTLYLTADDTNFIYVKPVDGYEYLGNTCGYILNDANVRNKAEGRENQLIITEVRRDTECVINFGERPFKVAIDNDVTDDNDSDLGAIYVLPKKSWYSDAEATNQITSVSDFPVINGYKTKGFYLNKRNGKIARGGSCDGTLIISDSGKLKNVSEVTSSLVSGDTKVFPCYEPYNYIVNFDCNIPDGSSTAPNSITHTYDTNLQLPVNSCSRIGYKFVGWNTASNGSGISYGTGSQGVKNIIYNPTEGQEVTLYAEWEKLTEYKATFEKNGAAGVGEESISCYTDNVETGCDIILPTITPSSGFDALGFSSDMSATSADYEVSTPVTIKNNTKFYAITKSIDSVVATFNKNGANSVISSLECYRYNGGSSCSINAPTPEVKPGYTLLGFNSNPEARESSWNVGFPKQISSDVTYYVIQEKKLTAKFIDNATTLEISCNLYNTNNECSVQSPTITLPTGFEAVGWTLDEGGTTSSLAVNGSAVISSNVKYYSITRKQYTVSFKQNGSKTEAVSGSCYVYNGSNSGCTITSPDITPQDGFSVIGWNTDSNATSSSWDAKTSKTITSDKIYYAITGKQVKITFKQNGSNTADSTQTCSVYNGLSSGCSIVSPKITPKSSFEVVGWNTNSNAKESSWIEDTSKNFVQDTTYYAITKSNPIVVVFADNGADSIGFRNQTCYTYNGSTTGCTITSPSITPRDGFDVVGWSENLNATTSSWSVGDSKNFTSSKTYYAITKSKNPIVVTFEKNGASSIGETSKSCYRYNGSSNCNIVAPQITPISGFEIVGWSSDIGDRQATWKVGESNSFNKNEKYYAITMHPTQINVYFVKNNAASIVYMGVEIDNFYCNRYNGESNCSILAPSIVAKDGYTVIGWNTDSNASESNWDVNEFKSFTADATYYAIATKSMTVTFAKDKLDVTPSTKECKTNFDKCELTFPSYDAKLYNTSNNLVANAGWRDSKSIVYSAGSKTQISSAQTFYSDYYLYGDYILNSGSGVNIRKGPGSNFDILVKDGINSVLQSGNVFTATKWAKESDGVVENKCPNNIWFYGSIDDSYEGWICSSYLKVWE